MNIPTNKCLRKLLIPVCLVVSVSDVPGAPGLPQTTAKLGYSIGLTNMSVNDPEGNTQKDWGAKPVTLIYTDWLVNDIRQWAEVFYYETTLNPDSDNIGQDIQRTGFRYSAQKNYRLSKSWSPWFGAGVDVSRTNYTQRHTVDSEGYLINKYEDRSENRISLILHLLSEWSVQRNWSVGAKLEQMISAENENSEFTAALTVLYRY